MSQTIRNRFSGLLAGALALAAAPLSGDVSKAYLEDLADLGYRVGDSVQTVPGFTFDNWKYLDSKHLVVYGEASKPYLVTLETRCDGMAANQVTLRPRQAGSLGLRDQVQVRHEGRVADRCDVETLNALLPAPG